MRSRPLARTLVRFAVFCGVTASSLVALPAAAEAAVEPSTTSFVTLNTAAGPWADAGKTRLWRSDVDQVNVTVWSGSLQASVNRAGNLNDWSSVTLSPAGGQFVAGAEYETDCNNACGGTQMYVQDADSDESCWGTGRFQVHAANEDLSSVWVSYQIACDGHAFFGEIRRNHPGTGPAFIVGEKTVFPEQYVGHAAGTAVVTVLNTDAQTLPVSEVAITGGEADFALVGTPCAAIAAGGSCSLTVRHTPIGEGARTGVLHLRLGETDYSATLTGTGALGQTAWNSWAEDLESYYAGKALEADPSNSRLDVTGYPGQLRLELRGANRRTATLYCGLEMPGGGCGVPQFEYENCYSGHEGQTTVHEAVFEDGVIARLSLTYRHRCVGGTGWEYGSIAWHATAPVPPLPGIVGVAPAKPANFVVEANYSSADLRWSTPLTPDWSEVQVWFKPGTSAPAKPGEAGSYLAYRGRATEAYLPGLHPNGAYSFSAFVKDDEDPGRWSPRSTFYVKATKLTLATSSTKTVYGNEITISGKLSGLGSGNSSEVSVMALVPGSEDTWYSVEDVYTDSTGAFSAQFAPARTYDYWVFWDGSGNKLGSNAGPVRVTVAKDVVAWAATSSGRLGTTFKIGAGVNPVATGKTITLERYVDGAWRKVTSAKTLGTKATYFSVKPSSRGTRSYRVVAGSGSGLVAGKSVTVKIKIT